MNKITTYENVSSIGRRNCEISMKEKKHPCHTTCVLSDAWFWILKILFWGLEIKFVEFYVFLKTTFFSPGAVSHNVLYYQQLPHTRYRYQVSFYANNNFE